MVGLHILLGRVLLVWLGVLRLLLADRLHRVESLLHDLSVEGDLPPLGVEDHPPVLLPDVESPLLPFDKRVLTRGSKQGGFSIPSLVVVPQAPLQI